jgi:GntR family transcriptional regulator, rspAB operon transcriptional repressor
MMNSKSKKNIVYEGLKKRIIGNSLKPGEPLNEGMLSKEMKISKTPVREALQQLERDGFVENVPGRGCFVSRISFQDVKELFETREILECEIIRRAALKGDPERIEGVRKKFEFLESNGEKTPKSQFKAGDRIHAYLFESFGNNRLNEIYRRLLEHVERMRIYFFTQTREERSEESYKEHLEILDALASQDPDRAEKAMRVHLRNAIDFLKRVI